MKWRDVVQMIKEAGGTPLPRNAGAYEKWRLPKGQIINVDTRHLNDQLTKHAAHRLISTIRGSDERR